MPTRAQRIEGGLVGLLVGDALGVPYEFEEPRPLDQIDFAPPPPGHWHAWPGTPPGTWSDDGSQALCLLDSLLTCGRLDPDDLGSRLLRCHTAGYMWIDGRVFDTGVTTAAALRLAGRQHGTGGRTHSRKRERQRLVDARATAGPVAQGHGRRIDRRRQNAVARHSRPSAFSALLCPLLCLARRTLEGAADPWREAVAAVREIHAGDVAALRELETEIRPDRPPGGKGSGYVVDCLHSARFAVAAGPYETAVKTAVGLGDDTDTTACVTGGIAGCETAWTPFRSAGGKGCGRELYQSLLEALLARS